MEPQSTLSIFLSLIIGGLVVPVIEYVKGKFINIPPATTLLLSVGLATGAAWGAAHFLAPGMTWEQLFKEALAAFGGAAIVNGGYKQFQENKK